MPEIPAIPPAIQTWLPLAQAIGLAILILIIGWVASKWVHALTLRAFRARKMDEALGRFISGIARYTVLAATVIASLGAVGIETTSLVAVFASAGLAVGLALQGNLANFASGVMLLIFRPFNLGDMISAGGHTGVVQDIGLFASTLLTPSNDTVVIPNAGITGGAIINHTGRGTRRGAVDVGVAYGADVVQVMQILTDAAKGAGTVLSDPGPAVAFVGLGASSLDFKVFAWSTSDDYLTMLHNVRHAVYDALNDAGIEIPYNQIVVHQA